MAADIANNTLQNFVVKELKFPKSLYAKDLKIT